jgi:hypothetical protein
VLRIFGSLGCNQPDQDQREAGESTQVNNVFVKRGKELHEPDRMYLNPTQILFAQPVGPNSKVAQLIAQASH